MKCALLSAVLLLSLALPAAALGDPERGVYKPVQGRENWDAEFDIAGMKAGKYNLVVRGTDAAGNVRYEGPSNLFIDPASDLPLVHISHPSAGARVGNLLSVVGTCVDDDGVKSVSVQLDDQDPVPAQGGEFWSYSLDVAAVPDGEHTLTARGIDVNGTEGKPQVVRFQIDKKPPAVRITSHASGAIVRGQARLEGEAEDANGLAQLTVSLDGGRTVVPLKLTLDKTGRRGTFTLVFDERRSPDGPRVLSFTAVDRTGSRSQHAFLLFVNNEAPVLEILTPGDGAAASGRLLVAGRATDRIGLKSLSFEVSGGEKGSIPLVPGNSIWTHSLDLSAKKAGPLQVSYSLENLTGNVQTARLTLRVDPEKDRPVVTIASPVKGARVEGTLLVSGFARDDDAVDRVEYSLDGAAPVSLKTTAAFSLALPDAAAGAHRLVVRAVDVNGVAGAPAESSFVLAGQPPRVAFDQLVTAGGSAPFAPGIVFAADREGRLAGTILGAATATQAEYSIQGAAARPLVLKAGASADQKTFEIPLAKGLAAGRVDISVKAKDPVGGAAECRSFLFSGPEQAGGEAILVDSRLGPDGTLRLDDRPLVGWAPGGPIRNADLDPPSDLVRVRIEGPLFRIEAAGQGQTPPTRILLTAGDGAALVLGPFAFLTDSEAPSVSVQSPLTGQWIAKDMILAGTVEDAGGLALLEYSVDGGSFTAVPVKAEASGASFSAAVGLGSLDDGPHLLVARATDRAGNAALVQVPFLRDTLAPAVGFEAPRPSDEVNGLVTVVGRIQDEGDIALVEVTEDGTIWREAGRQPSFAFDVNLSLMGGRPEALQVRATDAAGNVSVKSPSLTLNLAADMPVAQIQLPVDGALLRNDFALSGTVFDDDGVKALYWRMDGGEFQRLEGANNFSVPLSLDQVGDNEHVVEVKAEDVGGLVSAPVSSRFKVSRSDPVSTLASPAIAEYVRGEVELKGSSTDPNGIAEVRISFDNGLSFYKADGTESWRYRLDTRLLADGTQAVLVRATDATGAEGMFTTTINIDNGPPELVLDSPADGQEVGDSLPLGGRTMDSVGLASLAVSITPISAAAAAPARTFAPTMSRSGILGQEVDLRELAPGWYNLQLEAADRAGNRSSVSRNFMKRPGKEAERVQILFPAGGERLAGPFSVCGRVVSQAAMEGRKAVVLLDGQPLETAEIGAQGYFSLPVEPGRLSEGAHSLAAEVVLDEGARLSSEPRSLEYLAAGPWVRVSSFAAGDYVTGRPFLKGEAGWIGDEAKTPAGHKVRQVEISLDNGRSFTRTSGTSSWRHRLESQQLAQGPLRILVKAVFEDGSTAVTRTQLVVDTSPPVVTLLAPREGDRFNETVAVMGTAGDPSGLTEVAVSIREGDKSRYQVPSFIQGLYLDGHVLGATWWDAGLGLTFFDDNVKLQAQVGMSPTGRFSGFVIGAKLLANVASLPFGYLLGPSWDFFSMALAVGANFSYFTMSEDTIEFTDAGLFLGGVVGQLEFARFHVPTWNVLNDLSLYTEYQLWFISSDVEGGTASRLSFGMRVGLL